MTFNATPPQQKPSFSDLFARIRNLPKPETEESKILRALVLLLVIVGIIATDVAAAGSLRWFNLPVSVFAVPLTFLAGLWSWRSRKDANIGAKFLIAIGMLAMLLLFFRNLYGNLNDTRLVLAELLIQLQILHGFDLPRRKDLGYTMVIGLILIGVAGTVSQSLAFAPWLVLFLAIALPVLVLDYRSRLGLESLDQLLWRQRSSSQRTVRANLLRYSPLSPKRLGAILGIVLVLGMGIFTVMPRFPGYQLSTLPVSLPKDAPADQEFNDTNLSLANPGYESRGRNNGGTGGETFSDGNGEGGTSKIPLEGKGAIDKTEYYGFNSKINQNLRGEMEKVLVMRVRSQAPGYWRVMSFDHYTGQGWEVTDADELSLMERSSWAGRFFLSPRIPSQLRTEKIIQSYSAVKSLPNIIPAMTYPAELYFPTKEVAYDPEGNLRSPLGLLEGLTYTVVSRVPYRNRAQLAAAPAEYPERITKKYLDVPPEIQDKVRAVAEDILSRANSEITSPYEKALYLAQGLKQRFPQAREIPFFEEGDDLVESFLFKYQGGYSDHYATVLTIMLRSIGIPARFATGFGQGEFNPFTGYYLVHNTDAHAVTEAFFPGAGWFTFDPLPGHEIVPPSFEESGAFSVLKWFWQWVASWVPSPIAAFFEGLWTTVLQILGYVIIRLWRFVSGSLVGAIVGAIALSFGGMGIWLAIRQIQGWLRRRHFAKLPAMEQLYQRMLAQLTLKGHHKKPTQTPTEFLARLENLDHKYAPEAVDIIAELTHAYLDWRYGGKTVNTSYLQTQLNLLQKYLQRSKPAQ
jgi:transglutaminase-like putative cysteine protease